MRSIQLTSFEDIQALFLSLGRADAALAGALAKGNLQATQAALRAQASPLTAVDATGTPAFLLAARQPNAPELLCELLNVTGGATSAVLDADRKRLTVAFADGNGLEITPKLDSDGALLSTLCRFLQAMGVWHANFPPKDNETNLFARVRDANHRLVEGVRTGNVELVEAALGEGATALATDADGKPVLVWASEQPNHAMLLGALLANDPTVDLANGAFFRNQPGARMAQGGTAVYQPLGPEGLEMVDGHQIPVPPSLVNRTLKAHLNTRDDLEAAMDDLLRESHRRGAAVQLRWPNTVDFQRLLQDRYDASLAGV